MVKNFAAQITINFRHRPIFAVGMHAYRVTIIYSPSLRSFAGKFCTFNRPTRINRKFIFRIDGRNSAILVFEISRLYVFLFCPSSDKSRDKLNDFVISGGKISGGGKRAKCGDTTKCTTMVQSPNSIIFSLLQHPAEHDHGITNSAMGKFQAYAPL